MLEQLDCEVDFWLNATTVPTLFLLIGLYWNPTNIFEHFIEEIIRFVLVATKNCSVMFSLSKASLQSLCFIQNYSPSLVTSFSQLFGNMRIPRGKNTSILKLTTNSFNFWCLQMMWSATRANQVLSTRTSHRRKAQCLVNMAGGALFFNCSAQSHQLYSIESPCNDNARFQQLIIHDKFI